MAGGETDADRIARQMRAIDEVAALNRAAAAADAPGKFSLTELMLFITLLAVVLGLIRGLGIWGGLVTFVGSVALGNFIYPRWYSAEPQRQFVMFDCIWGLLMPLVCLVCDPFVFRDQGLEWGLDFRVKLNFRQETLSAYGLILWQMVFLLAWLIGRPWLKGFAGFFLGTWIAGIIFTAVLGILLVVPAAIGLVWGVGLMGFTPIFTTFVLSRRIRETIELSDESFLPFALLGTIGFFAAIVAPLQIAAWLQPLNIGTQFQLF